MKSALKKSVVSTSISLILASGMVAFSSHAAVDLKLKATKTTVVFLSLYADRIQYQRKAKYYRTDHG